MFGAKKQALACLFLLVQTANEELPPQGQFESRGESNSRLVKPNDFARQNKTQCACIVFCWCEERDLLRSLILRSLSRRGTKQPFRLFDGGGAKRGSVYKCKPTAPCLFKSLIYVWHKKTSTCVPVFIGARNGT